MAAKIAHKTAAKAPKPEPVTLDLADLSARYGGRITAWHKPVKFDHAHIAATAVCVALATPEGFRISHIQCYNGRITPLQVRHLETLDQGRLADSDKLAADLEKRGYSLAIAPAKKGRAKKGAK